jgi:hypothetical protein
MCKYVHRAQGEIVDGCGRRQEKAQAFFPSAEFVAFSEKEVDNGDIGSVRPRRWQCLCTVRT